MLHSPFKLRCFFNSAEEKGLIALSARVKPTRGGKKKTPIQRSIERLESYIDKLKEYTAKLHICGDRNSYSKTDHDATFMRLKEDAILNGQLKPAYNLQHAVEAQYITWLQVCARPTDVSPLVPFLKDMESHLGFKIRSGRTGQYLTDLKTA